MTDPEDPGGPDGDSHRVVLSDEQSVPVDVRALEAVARHALASLGVPHDAELSLLLVDRERIAELKEVWLGERAPTDVLAFPMDAASPGDGQPVLLGDVVLCPAVATEQAVAGGRAFEDELNLLLVHGILHLLGHDHAEPLEKAAMWAEQDRILAGAGR